MSWVRKKSLTIELSPAPNITGWLMVGALVILLGVLLFVIHASGSVKFIVDINIWILSLVFPLCWVVAFCGRCWLREREENKYIFLQQEAERDQHMWELWAQRYLAILASSVQLPDGISAVAIIKQGSDAFPSRGGLTRKLKNIETPLMACLASVQTALRSLPSELPLRFIVLYDGSPTTVELALPEIWKSVLPELSLPDEIIITDELSMAHLEERLMQPTLTVDLIIVMQMHGADLYSDGMAAFVITSDDVAEKYQLNDFTRLLRPMSISVETFEADLELFLQTQTPAIHTSRVLADALLWENTAAQLMTTGKKFKTRWHPSDRLNLEKIIGVSGRSGQWLLIALASDLVRLRDESMLTLYSADTQQYISTLDTGRKNEKAG